ncbi:NRDE family protein [Altererythrobacter arenosus]|uniref:NRDE family protein n=1 Tax=Altererythrobacter arenosus TaxID=3032592 RepID=A0ABY8FP18_9SPHN|nr:NRDE family protein [Altererythrobacter sp. CAU 1644]WFL76763.1 NRDE family protein [Altererythrobacter sp. CAU 1644]
MCVAAVAWNAHPDWQLVAIGNRDEFHQRPAAPLARWDDPEGVIAGRDLQSGGTWLGVTEAGRFVLVTNLRGYGAPDPSRRSRGELVTGLLAGKHDGDDLQQYNPFNIIEISGSQARFLTNRPEDTAANLPHGIYGLSNGRLDEPWAKTLQSKGAMLDWLGEEDSGFAPLFDVLADDSLDAFGTQPITPSDVAIEPSETPPFIRHSLYGTRCSTVVTVDREGIGRIVERRFDASGRPTGETEIGFGWPRIGAWP